MRLEEWFSNCSRMLTEVSVSFLVIFYCVSTGLSSSWSKWTPCDEENCIQRTLLCRTNSSSTYKCNHGSMVVEERLLNCSVCNGTWKAQFHQECNALISSTSRWELSTCSSDPLCTRRRRYPCSTLPPCGGTWTVVSKSCNALCNQTGGKTLILEHFSSSDVSCTRAPIKIRQRLTNEKCTNTDCNDWSDWKTTGSCTHSCGGGLQRQERICLNNTGCSSPRESESRAIPCKDFPCPSWGVWSGPSECTEGVRPQTRLCLLGDSLSGGCPGHQGTSETRLQPCLNFNQSDEVKQSRDQTFYISLILGILLLILILFLSFYFGCRKIKRKQFKIKENKVENGDKKDSFTNGSFTPELRLSKMERREDLPLQAHSGSLPPTSDHKNKDDLTSGCFTSSPSIPADLLMKSESYPDIGFKVETPKSERGLKKSRPSMRRAEERRKKEEEEARSMKKDLSWRRTQTLHHISPNPYENVIILPARRGRTRSHSVESLSEFDNSPVSPIKPARYIPNVNELGDPMRNRSHSFGSKLPSKSTNSIHRRTSTLKQVTPGRTRRMNSIQPPLKPRRSIISRATSFDATASHRINLQSHRLSTSLHDHGVESLTEMTSGHG